MNCEALRELNQSGRLDWEVRDSRDKKHGTRVAYCNGKLNCVVLKESLEEYGIHASVSNGALSIKRSSRNMSVEFWCTVHRWAEDSDPIRTKINLSLECKFSDIILHLFKTPPSLGLSFSTCSEALSLR